MLRKSFLLALTLLMLTALAVPEQASAQSVECQICTGEGKPKVTSLTFRFNGPDPKFILIQDKDNVNTYFSGIVNPGEEFTANGTSTDGKFHKNDLDMVILSSDPGLPYDTDYDGGDIDVITIHVSCSKPLFFGMDLADQEGKEDPNPEDLGKFTLTGGTDTNGDEICEVPPPPPSCSICDGEGSPKVTSLTFRFNGADPKFILIQDKDNDNTYFSGIVNPGEEFTASGTDTDGKFHQNDLDMIILSSDPGAPYDTAYDGGDIDVITIHVSCSKPLFFGMDLADQEGKEDPNPEDLGKFTLTGGTDTNGDEICEVPPPPPSCSICDGEGSPKVTSLTFRFNGADPKFILIQDKDNDNTYFSGIVNPGEEFTANGTDTDGKFHQNDLDMIILDNDPGAPYNTEYDGGDIDVITIHVSCSKPLFFGMDLANQPGKEDPNPEDLGKFTLTGGTDTNGDAICRIDLELEKTVDGPDQDGKFTYTLTVTNSSDAQVTATNVFVTDILPAGLIYENDAIASQGAYAHPVWDVGSLAISASATLTFKVSLNPQGGETRNCAEVTGATEGDIDSTPGNGVDNDEDDQDCIDLPIIDLELEKSVSAPDQNGNVTYTVTVTNQGSSTATGVVVTDNLPAGVSYVSHNASQGAYDPNTGLWTIGTMNANDVVTLTIVAHLLFNQSTIVNCAEVSAADQNDIDSTPGNAHLVNEDDNDCTPEIDLELEKSVSPPDHNNNVTYIVTVTNKGPDTATGVVVTDNLPAGVSYVSHNASQGAYDPNTGLWIIGTMNKDDVVTLTIVAHLLFNQSTTINCAEVSAADQNDIDSTPGNANQVSEDDDDCTPEEPEIDLELEKSVSSPDQNGNVTYTVTVTNQGPGTATGVVVTDNLPAGVSYVSHNASQGAYVPNTGLWTIGTMNANDVVTLTIVAHLLFNQSTIVNCAEVSAANETDIDSTPGNADQVDEDDNACTPEIDLELEKSVSAPDHNGNVTYTVTVTNQGPDTATGVVVTDNLPAGVSYVSHNASQGAYVPNTGLWTIGTMNANDVVTLTIVAHLLYNESTIVNCAEVSAADQNDIDSTPGNANQVDEDDNDCTPEIDLELEKSVSAPDQNGNVTYTVTVTNQGPDTATGVVVTDNLPAGVSYVSHNASQGAYVPNTGLWTIGTMNANDVVTLTIVAHLLYNQSTIINCAEVSAANEPDIDSTPGNANQVDEDDNDCTPEIDLELEKSVSAPDHNGNVTYTVTVTNQGPDTATGVVVTDNLPAGVSYVSHVASQGVYLPGSGLWTIGTMNANDVVTLTIVAHLLGNQSTTVNCAEVSAADQNDIDSTPGNANQVSEDDDDCNPEEPEIDLELEKSVSSPDQNGNVTYTVTVTNQGPGTATGVVVTDNLPAGVSYVSHNASQGAYVPNTGLWTIGTMNANDVVTLTIVAHLLFNQSTIVNCAEVSAANETDIDSTPGNADQVDEDDNACTPEIDLELEKSVSAPDQNGNVTYTVTVTNKGPDTATGVVVTDNLPAGVSYVSHNASQGAYDPNTGLWIIGTMNKDDVVTLTIVAHLLGNQYTTINCAEVSAADQNDIDSTPGNAHLTSEDDDDCNPDEPEIDLELEKSVSAPDQNGDVTYTVTVTNQGPGTATGVVVTDNLPAGVSYVSHNASQGAYVPNTGLWTIGTMNANDVVTLTIVAHLLFNQSTIINCAEVSAANETDIDSTPGNANQVSEDDDDCTGEVDIEVLKTASNLTPGFGDQFTYTITVTNKGPDDANNLVIEDILPAGVSYVSHVTSAGVYNPGNGLWTLPFLAAFNSETLMITVQVTGGGGGGLVDGVYRLHNHPANGLQPPGYGLRLDELFGGLSAITFDFDHPNSLVLMTISGNGTSIHIEGDVFGGYDAGAAYDPALSGLWDLDYTFANVVSNVPADDDLHVDDNNSEVSTGTIIPQFGTVHFAAFTVYDLLDKSDGVRSFRLGDEDNDLGFQGFLGISGWGWLQHGLNGNVSHTPISDWVFTALPINDSITNCAELIQVDETDSDSIPDDGEGDDYSCVTVNPGDPEIDLSLEKNVDLSQASVGDTIHYTLAVTNDAGANAVATNITVVDMLPPGVTVVDTTPAANVIVDNPGGTVTWFIPALAPGQTVFLDIEAVLTSAGVKTNCAEITAADQPTPGEVYGNGNGTDYDCATTTTDDPFIDLSMVKHAFPVNPGVGDIVDYEIRVRNDGIATAFGITVVDNVPPGLSIVSTNPIVNVTVNNFTNVVSWFIPSLTSGSEVILHIFVQVDDPGTWNNCAEVVSAIGFDPDSTPGDGMGDDYDCAKTETPDPTIDLSLEKTVDDANPNIGQNITFTLSVTNANSATEAATNVVVEDQLPAGLMFVGPAPAGVTVSITGLITWDVGTVGIGVTKSVDLVVKLIFGVLQVNCAQVTAADQDDVDSIPDNGVQNGEDDQDCVTITPDLVPDDLMCYLVADNQDHLGSDDVLTYITTFPVEVEVGNTGTQNINAIEYVGEFGKLYASDGNRFGTLHQGTGVFSAIGFFGAGFGSQGAKNFDNVDGLALDPFTGILYGTVRTNADDLLIQINLVTGAAVLNAFGPGQTYVVIPSVLGLSNVDDIAIRVSTGIMYGVMNGAGNTRLVTIDKATGASANQVLLDVTNVRGLAFRADGVLLGSLASTINEVRSINIGNGATALIANLGINGNFDYEAITCNTNLPNWLSGTVFLDNNENAVFDGGDVGQVGVLVNLYRDNGFLGVFDGPDMFVGSLITNGNGDYHFPILDTGNFIIVTDLGTYPAGAVLTTDNVETAFFNGFGQNDPDNDFGFKIEPIILGSIGDFIFDDANANGVQDIGEIGIGGVLVRLYSGACPAFGAPIATRVSNPAGGYDFTSLPAGTYCVDVDDFTVPAGYVHTTANDPMTVMLANAEDFNLADFGYFFDPVAAQADLELTKEVDTSSPALDDVVTFTITITNHGPADATGLIVRDIIPVGLVFQDYTSTFGSFEANKLGFWTIGNLAVGHTQVLTIRTKVVITNMIENIAQVSHVDQEDPDSTPGNGVPSEDDQDNALVESRGPGSVGDIIRVECADMGTVNALQYSTFDHQIYSGTEVGSLHISNDDGQNWPVFLNTDNDAPIRDIVINTFGDVYAGTFGDGVYVSFNQGDNWTNIGPVLADVNDLDVDDNTNYVYAAVNGKVIVYNGVVWSTVGVGSNPFVGEQVLAVVYDENNGRLLASSAGSGVFKFEGGVWTAANGGLSVGKINTLFRGPNGEILAGTNSNGVYIFGGVNWFQFGMGLDGEPIESLGSGPNGELLAGARESGAYFYNFIIGEWVSIGNLPVFTVSAITGGPLGEVYAGAPGEGIYLIFDQDFDGIPDIAYQVANFMTSAVIQDLVIAPNGDMWAATYGYGILYSSDGGNCWTRMNRGLDNLYTFAIERRTDGTLFIGIWADGLGGIWRSHDGGRNWVFLALPTRQIISLAIDPMNENIIYAGANIAGGGALFKSINGGTTGLRSAISFSRSGL